MENKIPEWSSGKNKSLVVKSAHQNIYTLVLLADEVRGRHFDVVEDELASVGASHAEFVQFGHCFEARHSLHRQHKTNLILQYSFITTNIASQNVLFR